MQLSQKDIYHIANLYKSNKFRESETLCKKLIKDHPKKVILYNLLGLTLTNLNKLDEAIKYFNEGLEVDKNYAEIYSNLGNVYRVKGEVITAENHFKKSIKLNNKLPETYNNLGNLYRSMRKHKEALPCYKKSFQINSNFYPAYYNYGVVCLSLGLFEEAKIHLKKSIKINPNFFEAHRILSKVLKYKPSEEHLDQLKKIFKNSDIDKIKKKEIAFALGKAFEDIENFDDSFKCYSEGNYLHRKSITYKITDEKKEFELIKESFNKNILNLIKPINHSNMKIIFILGMPRSGTTLIEQIISSHKDIYGGDELPFMPNLVNKYFYKDNLFNFRKLKSFSAIDFKNIGNEYLDKIKSITKNKKVITDKLPINFKWIGFIKLILPNSVIINCNRNPKDTCFSIFKNFFINKKIKFAYNLDEIVNFYNLYQDLMLHWKKTYPNCYFDVQYEKIIQNTEVEIKSLIQNCNLKWDPNCLKFDQNKRAIQTASDTQARNKIYKNSIESWKNYKKYLDNYFDKISNY